MSSSALALALFAGVSTVLAVVQCPSPVQTGCALPTWDVRWSMRGSLYTYCYQSCPLAFFANHTSMGTFSGVVGVDHYWTKQGMPCLPPAFEPTEFANQDAFADATKAVFPGTRILQYRITDAVPYDSIVHDLMIAHPEYFVRWDNGTVCQMWFQEAGTTGHNCSWEVRAAAYDWSQAVVRTWFLDNIIKPVMKHGDGVWLDGDGPDNGAWGCSGSYDWGKLPAPYPALNESGVAAFCAGENLVQAAAHEWLFANGGMDGQACWSYFNNFPMPGDSAATCAAKLYAANNLTSSMAVGFGMDRTGQRVWNDASAAPAVAAFMLTRKAYWFFGAGGNGVNGFAEATAALLLSDHGAPTGGMTVSGNVFSREYEQATVSLDCGTMEAVFSLKY